MLWQIVMLSTACVAFIAFTYIHYHFLVTALSYSDVKDDDYRVLIGWLCMTIMIEMDGRRELERWDDKRHMHGYYIHGPLLFLLQK